MWPNNSRQHETHQTTTRRIGIDGVCSANLVGKICQLFLKKGFRRVHCDTLLASGVDNDFGLEDVFYVCVDNVVGFALVWYGQC